MSRQKKLQAEAKLALAMAKPMAKMQVEVEKQNRKKSPVADLVSTRHRHSNVSQKLTVAETLLQTNIFNILIRML